MNYIFKDRSNIHLGSQRNFDLQKEKEEEVKEAKEYISDVIEEEDMKECLLLFLKHSDYHFIRKNNVMMNITLSKLSSISVSVVFSLF